MAASATFALKAGVWFRRGRLVMVSPDSLAQRARCQAETPPIVLCRFPKPALYTVGERRKFQRSKQNCECLGSSATGTLPKRKQSRWYPYVGRFLTWITDYMLDHRIERRCVGRWPAP